VNKVQYKHNHLITKGTYPMKNRITALGSAVFATAAIASALVGHADHTKKVEAARVQTEQRQAAQAQAAREAAAAKVKADEEAAAAAKAKTPTSRLATPTPTPFK
jgi:hypothetical protein